MKKLAVLVPLKLFYRPTKYQHPNCSVVKGPQMGFIVLFASCRSTQFMRQSQTDSAAKSISAPFYSTVLRWSRDQSWCGHVTKVSR
jgi:hypothetical protein